LLSSRRFAFLDFPVLRIHNNDRVLAGRLIPTRPSKEPRGDTVPQSRYYPNIIGPPVAPSIPFPTGGRLGDFTHTSLASRGGVDLGVRSGH
jgi:hypothetical protein